MDGSASMAARCRYSRHGRRRFGDTFRMNLEQYQLGRSRTTFAVSKLQNDIPRYKMIKLKCPSTTAQIYILYNLTQFKECCIK